MLQNTFIHIQSIGTITEQRLWESGLSDWDVFSDAISMPLSGSRKFLLKEGIGESKRHLDQGNPGYFSKLLPANQCWRLFPEFRDSTVYLDIETTGLERYYHSITTIALYDGHEIKTYVQGQNLDDFIEDIQQYDEYQKSGDQKALDTLLAYNVQDTVTLENLMVKAYNLKLRETPFYDNLLIEESAPPANSFSTDLATIDRIKSSSQYWGSDQWY